MSISLSLILVITPEATKPELEICLESVLSHTLDMEVLAFIAKDSPVFSTLETYANRDSRVKLHYMEGKTYGSYRNIGIISAQGKYIGFLYPNTGIDTGFYDYLIGRSESTGCPVAMGNMVHYKDGRLYSEEYTYLSKVLKNSYHLMRYPQTLLFKRSYLTDNSIFWSMGNDEDGLFFLTKVAAYAGTIAILSDTFCHDYKLSNVSPVPISSSTEAASYFLPWYQSLDFILRNRASVSKEHAVYVISELFTRYIEEFRIEVISDEALAYGFQCLIQLADTYLSARTSAESVSPIIEAFSVLGKTFEGLDIKKLREYDYLEEFIRNRRSYTA